MTFISPITDEENRRRRRASGEVLADGEYIGAEAMFMRDSTSGSHNISDAAAGSIDEAVKLEIASQAKSQNMKPSEWLAQNAGAPLTKLIQRVAETFVQAAGGAGVTAAFSLDRCAQTAIRDIALADCRDGQEAAYQRSKSSVNDWRRQLGDTAMAAIRAPSSDTQAELAAMTADARAEYDRAKSRAAAEAMNAWRKPAGSQR